MNRLEFLAFLLAVPMVVHADDKEPTPDELKAALAQSLALIDHYASMVTELQQENDKLTEQLSIDRGCT